MTLHTAGVAAGGSDTRLFPCRVTPGPFAHVEKLLEQEFSTMASGAKEDGINNFVRPDDPAMQATVVPEIVDPLLEHASPALPPQRRHHAHVDSRLFAVTTQLGTRCRRWDLNPHALAGNGF
jgi:hypothetical protein